MNPRQEEKYPPEKRKPRILVAPLDWGLGHATRCIPVIRELIDCGCEVYLAGEGAQETLLRTEFPSLPFLLLPGYRIRYGRSSFGLLKNILFQTSKILKAIRHENSWLSQVVDEHQLSAVISDNRYGLFHSKIPCVFITHQLTIKTPLGKWVQMTLQKKNYRYVNKFTECWIPDTEDEINLAGELSHPAKKPTVPLHYVGLLSRFVKKKVPEQKNHLLIILSGPEPQRSILENKIINEIANYGDTATVVRGLPGEKSLMPSTNMIKFYNHLPANDLNDEMEKAQFIIGRSGYSTIMDVIALQKKAILIPTPGQTEQEYLASNLLKKQLAFTICQKQFSLGTALEEAKKFPYQFLDFKDNGNLRKKISDFIGSYRLTTLG